MTALREATMGKIKASIDGYEFSIKQEDLARLAGEDAQLDEAAAVQSNKELLEAQRLEQAKIKTEADLLRLEEAKRKATSAKVKAELANEQQNIKDGIAEREAEKEEEDKTPPDFKELTKSKAKSIASGATDTFNRILDVGKQLWDSLAQVTTPGSIFLPLGVLVVFFLLLLPVNGHTRAEWLWLALTGNAHISGGGTADLSPSTGSQAGTVDLSFQQPTTNTFTGVQEL